MSHPVSPSRQFVLAHQPGQSTGAAVARLLRALAAQLEDVPDAEVHDLTLNTASRGGDGTSLTAYVDLPS